MLLLLLLFLRMFTPSNPTTLLALSRVLFVILVQDGEFPGLIPLIESYLGNVDVDIDTRCTISQYLKLISRRASGEWLMNFDLLPDRRVLKIASISLNLFID